MDILNIKPYKGKNIYSFKPVIKTVVDLGNLYDTPTCSINGFNERLLQMLPGLQKHYCSLGYEGGFTERLREGTYLAHVTEHMALELQSLAGYDVHYGKSRELEAPSIYYIVFEYKNEKYAVECLLAAVEMINMLIVGEMPEMDSILQHLAKTAAETDLGPSTSAIYEEALKRNIPVTCLENSGILQLGYGKYTHFVEASLTDKPGCIAVDFAGNKHLTKKILSEEGIPVPFGDIAYTVQSAVSAASAIGYPVVIKPFDANQGKGVFINISSSKELERAFHTAVKYSRAVIVEKHIPGRDYRLLAVGGKLAAAAERKPPNVTGDGIHTVKQLVDMENKNPLRGTDHEKPLTRIKLDDMSRQVLAKEGYDENSIPAKGANVLLRYNGNISTGGTARDCTDEVHPDNAQLAVMAAELLGLDVAGIDITCKDISMPLTPDNGAVIEVNVAPGLRMHLYPAEGKPRNVAGDIVELLYPRDRVNNIPIVSVTGTNGKTTVTRLIAHTLGMDGKVVGMTCTSGVYVNGECILKGDNTGAMSAAKVLQDRRIDAAVLETARGGIIKKGLGYDLADVGVVVNISNDHMGLDGISTMEELAMVKSLVVEAVKPDGFAVLNASDEMTPFLMKRVKCRTMLFSANDCNLLLVQQINKGNRVVYARSGSIYLVDEGREILVAGIDEIPITFKGMAECNVENSLAAVSALLALGISIDAIRKGLTSFKPDISTNPGRFNIFDMGNFSVMLDYGHNPAGYRAVIDMIGSIGATAYTGVIGMPGDRKDESICEVGRICGHFFSKLYIKEDIDLRGRNAGEVADILYDAAVGEGMSTEDITVIYSETKALETAIMDAQPGELVVLFYEELDPALEVLEKCRSMIAQRDEKAAPSETKASETAAG
ncbi:MAG: cyanophycin synthetase [Clostridiaceae bacterium]